jgi:hypothetical protein
MKKLDKNKYLFTEQKSYNVKSSFYLINTKRLEKFPAKSKLYDYFLAVYKESHDLFVLSALAALRSLLNTFKEEIAKKAIEWFCKRSLL